MTKIGNNNNNNNNLSNFNKSAIAWFIIYIAIGLTISFIVPFPLSLIFYIGIYLLLQTHRIKSIQKRYHYSESNSDKENNKTKDKKYSNKFFKSLSNILFGDSQFPPNDSQSLKLVCMNCGKEHKDRTCPSCGSTAVRLG
jgi:hypothetical protein